MNEDDISISPVELQAIRGLGQAGNAEQGWQQFQAKVSDVPKARATGSTAQRSWGRWVAGAGVLGVALFALFLNNSDKPTAGASSYKTYSTRAGQRASLSLHDGSRVTLGPSSILRVSTGKDDETSVEVTGEALFNVSHSADHPFTVISYGVTTRVLGTEFIVRAYDASTVRVAVRDGKVSIKQDAAPAVSIVTAGEVAVATPAALTQVTLIADLATEFGWANGELVLHNVPVSEAFNRLSRWYGIEFRVESQSLLADSVNAIFPSTFSNTDMRGLADALGASMTQSGQVLTFRSR